jgi:hypothetical protein
MLLVDVNANMVKAELCQALRVFRFECERAALLGCLVIPEPALDVDAAFKI